MPIIFTINKTRETFEQQWDYLAKRAQKRYYDLLKKYSVLLFVITFSFSLFYFLTPLNDFITFKGVSMVMIFLGWCSLLIIFFFIVLSNIKSQRRLRKFLNSTMDEQLTYDVQIDEERVSIFSQGSTFEFPWAEFDCYGLNGETLYVFNAMNRINSLYWDRNEMGNESFSALLELVSQKTLKQVF